MNPLQPIGACQCGDHQVGDLGTLSIDIGAEIRDFVAANPVMTAGLIGLVGLALYELFKTR
jgi:hypothetical protein